jgi:secondary thiamine-phosphate synthase enzyme
MKSQNSNVSVSTEHKQQLLNLTPVVAETVRASGISNGLVAVYSQHTTAALFVTECQDALLDDVLSFITRVVEDGRYYKHNCPELSDCERQNAAAHLRSILLGHSVLAPVVDGKPVLGQFQSVLLAELDGPRHRTVHVQVMGQ